MLFFVLHKHLKCRPSICFKQIIRTIKIPFSFRTIPILHIFYYKQQQQHSSYRKGIKHIS